MRGGLRAVAGAVTLDGQVHFQLIDEGGKPRLVPVSALGELDVKTVWLADARSEGTIPIKVGSATLGVDRLWHNFGLTEPFSRPTAPFRFVNLGDSPLRLQLVSTSCGCVAAEFEEDKVLDPGQVRQLVARVSTSGGTAYKQTIGLRILDLASGMDRPLILSLIGNQVRIMSLSLESVDFGTLRKEDPPATRSLRLFPTQHDQFEVSDVMAEDLPITWTIRRQQASKGEVLEQGHEVVLTLDPSAFEPGVYRSKVNVITTSRFRPVVEVPVRLKIRYHVEAIPSVAAFGFVAPNAAKERRIHLISSDESPFSARVLSSPKDCETTVVSNNDSVVLSVKPRFQKEGLYQRDIVVGVSSDSWEEEVKVQCVAYVKP